MRAFKCDSCGSYYDDDPNRIVKVIFSRSEFCIVDNIEPDICEDCQVKIAKMFPQIKVRNKETKELI